jgi:hypothetical protein
MTPAQIREAAHSAILKELGVVGLVRYLQDQSMGSGDYTRDRLNWLPEYQSVDEMMADLQAKAQVLRERGELP